MISGFLTFGAMGAGFMIALLSLRQHWSDARVACHLAGIGFVLATLSAYFGGSR